jgi:chemotaxis protein methyltransferase WspC
LREALETIDRALSQGGPMPGLFALMGAALLALGRPEAAEEAFRRCLYLDPCHVEALSHLELMARAAGRGEEASRLSARLKRAGEPRRLA